MPRFPAFARLAPLFTRDTRGNFAVIGAAAAAVLALAVGYGLNTAQLFNVRSNLSHALDAAVTSTARDLTTGKIGPADARGIVEAFLQANTRTGFSAQDLVRLERLVVDERAKTVEASASVEVGMAFPLFGSERARRVSAESAALYSDRNIEVAMMLDVTLSMRGRKIEDLKGAATRALNALLSGQDPRNPRVRVSLVPYSEAVNVGALADSTVFAERPGGPDLPPAIGAPIQAGGPGRPDTCATERKTPGLQADFSDDSPFTERRKPDGSNYLAKVNRDDRLAACPAARLVPLTADLAALERAVSNIAVTGTTSGNIAVQWAYYMLSPRWRSAVRGAGLGDGPANHDPRDVGKIAILMTDGQFNTAFAGVGTSERTALAQGPRSRSYAESLCANMKRDGIEIFSIGFDLDNPSMSRRERDDAKAVLRNCATTDTSAIRHYYEASTAAELDAAYMEIVRNIERLALTR